MPLDRIQSANPEIRPPQPEKVFPDLYIANFAFGFDGVGRQPVSVEYRPYNYDTKEISDNRDAFIHFHIPNLWEEAYRSSLVADTAGRLTVLLSLMYQEYVLRGKLAGPDYTGREADVAALQQVQTALGAPVETIEPAVTETHWVKPPEPSPEPEPAPAPEPAPEPTPEPTTQEVWDSLSFTTFV
jgi:cell division septation protein DedD